MGMIKLFENILPELYFYCGMLSIFHPFKLPQHRFVLQEYIGGFCIIIKNKNRRPVFKPAFYLPEFRFPGCFPLAIIGAVSGNKLLYHTLQGFRTEFADRDFVDGHY